MNFGIANAIISFNKVGSCWIENYNSVRNDVLDRLAVIIAKEKPIYHKRETMTKEQLLEEKKKIEGEIKYYEADIESSKNAIHWQKKRLKLVEAQLKSLPEEKEKV